MRIHVLALDGVFDTGLATVLDTLATANELAPLAGIASLRFEIATIGVRRRVRTAQGLTVPVRPATSARRPDWLVIPAIGHKMPDTLLPALAARQVADAGVLLRRWTPRGTRVAAACIGTFVLAESGLLDGGIATTTWWLAPLFRQRYPAVELDETRILVASGAVVTAGAALSHLDLALAIVRDASPELASLVARYLVVDSRSSQQVYSIPHHLAHADPLVERFERWARAHLSEGFDLDTAAAALATSKRTLARRLDAVLGRSPLAYVQDLRVERAVHLLKTSKSGVEAIAAAVGYGDGLSLRALLRRRLGKGVREIRSDR